MSNLLCLCHVNIVHVLRREAILPFHNDLIAVRKTYQEIERPIRIISNRDRHIYWPYRRGIISQRELSPPSISPSSAGFPSPRFVRLSAFSSQTLIDAGWSMPLSLSRQITSRPITPSLHGADTIFPSTAADISLHFFAKGNPASSFAARGG